MQSVVSSRSIRGDRARGRRAGSVAFRASTHAGRFLATSLSEAPNWMRRWLFASLLILCGLIGHSGYQSVGKIPNGVTVAGMPIGGLHYDHARAVLDQRAHRFNQQQVTLTFRDETWTPTLAELGVTLDTTSAWSSLKELGSGRHVFDRTLRALHLRSGQIALGTPLRIDTTTLQRYCAERMSELGLAPTNAEVSVSGDSISVTPDSHGFVVSIDRLQQDLVRRLTGFTAPTIDLVATYAPAPIRAEELEPQIAPLNAALKEPLRLHTATEQWDIPGHQLAEHVTITEVNGRPLVGIDESALSSLVDSIANDIDQPLVTGGIDDSGLYPKLVAPHDGVRVDRAELGKRIQYAVAGGPKEIEIPVTVMPGGGNIESVLTDYGVRELIAAGSSSFTGSDAAREANVRRAAGLIDGTLVAPGDIFSFNQALGVIVDDGGFVPAGAIESPIPDAAIGGGICQVSTSLFRAVLTAGLPIIEWHPHPYRNLFYEQDGSPPGLDACIQQPDDDPLNGEDLSFRNVTEGWLLIRVTANVSGNLTVALYGSAPGYDVEIWDPSYGDIIAAGESPIEEIDLALPPGSIELWQPARDGVTMTIHRTVHAADGSLLLDEDFVSYYQPQGPVYRVSTDMAGSSVDA